MTGGLAAPLIAAGAATIIGSAGAAALGSVAGIAVMTSLFGAAGASLTGKVPEEGAVRRVARVVPSDGSPGDGGGTRLFSRWVPARLELAAGFIENWAMARHGSVQGLHLRDSTSCRRPEKGLIGPACHHLGSFQTGLLGNTWASSCKRAHGYSSFTGTSWGRFPKSYVSAAPHIPVPLLTWVVAFHIGNLGQFDPLLLKGVCCTPEVCGQEK